MPVQKRGEWAHESGDSHEGFEPPPPGGSPPLTVLLLDVGQARDRAAQLLPHRVHVPRLQRPVDEGHRRQHLHCNGELGVREAMLDTRDGDHSEESHAGAPRGLDIGENYKASKFLVKVKELGAPNHTSKWVFHPLPPSCAPDQTGPDSSLQGSAAAGWPAPSGTGQQRTGTPGAAGLRGSLVPEQSSQQHPSGWQH